MGKIDDWMQHDRMDRERADAFIAAVRSLAARYDYAVVRGDVSLNETPGSGQPATVEIVFTQLPADTAVLPDGR